MGNAIGRAIGCGQSYESILADIVEYADKCERDATAPELKAVQQLARRAFHARRWRDGRVRSSKKTLDQTLRPGSERAKWTNVLGNVTLHPRVLHTKDEVTTLEDLVRITEEALAADVSLRAVGSGHSYSTCQSTDGHLIETHGLNTLAQAPGSSVPPIAAQLDPGMLRAGSLPLVRQGESPPWPSTSYSPVEHKALVESESGITILDFAQALEKMDLAMSNMGGASWQTLAGYVSTSTHGSGIGLGPVCDSVRSLVLVTSGAWKPSLGSRSRVVRATAPPSASVPSASVYVYRIEPYDGITDASRYSHPTATLIQNDDAFRAVVCSFGSMGVVYSFVMEVMQFYWVRAVATQITWSQALSELQPAPVTRDNPHGVPAVLRNHRNVQYFWSPYPKDPYSNSGAGSQDHLAVRLEVDIVPKVQTSFVASVLHALQGQETVARVLFDMAITEGYFAVADLQIVYEVTALIMDMAPALIPLLVNSALQSQATVGNRAGKWYEVYNLGTAENAGFASEYAFPLQRNKAPDPSLGSFQVWPKTASQAGGWTVANLDAGVQSFARTTAAMRRDRQYATSPLGIRFVARSDKPLSMMHGSLTGMIELDMAYGTFAYQEILRTQGWRLMRDTGARFHWGLNFNNQTGANNLIGLMYPGSREKWLAEMRKFNARNTYTNDFLVQLGLSGSNYLAGLPAAQRARGCVP